MLIKGVPSCDPIILKPDLMLRISYENVLLYLWLIALCYVASARCLIFPSLMWPSAHHCISLAVFSSINNGFKWGVIGKDHTTFVGSLLFRLPFIVVAELTYGVRFRTPYKHPILYKHHNTICNHWYMYFEPPLGTPFGWPGICSEETHLGLEATFAEDLTNH